LYPTAFMDVSSSCFQILLDEIVEGFLAGTAR
jgi:hypothetical protein